ncbi:MAG: hypothetical protein NTX50_13800, partial [Candidatus Sumerlaeota bacterium]|nr:hypothetical protein [Candidatus Sumerlaeota bacterium]
HIFSIGIIGKEHCMKRRLEFLSFCFAFVMLCGHNLAQTSNSPWSDEVLRQQIKQFIINPGKRAGAPPEYILSAWIRMGVPKNKLISALMDFATSSALIGEKKEEDIKAISSRSVYFLGCMRVIESEGLIEDIATSDPMRRQTAVESMALIGGEKMIPFSEKVFRERAIFSDKDRYVLYRTLSEYLGINFENKDQKIMQRMNYNKKPVNEEVRSFFIMAISDEPYMESVYHIDMALGAADPNYKNSDTHKKALSRLKQSNDKKHLEYAERELLRASTQ